MPKIRADVDDTLRLKRGTTWSLRLKNRKGDKGSYDLYLVLKNGIWSKWIKLDMLLSGDQLADRHKTPVGTVNEGVTFAEIEAMLKSRAKLFIEQGTTVSAPKMRARNTMKFDVQIKGFNQIFGGELRFNSYRPGVIGFLVELPDLYGSGI